MRGVVALLGKLVGVVAMAVLVFAAIPLVLVVCLAVLGVSAVSFISLAGMMALVAGWLATGEAAALRAAGIVGVWGATAFAAMVVFFYLVAEARARMKRGKPAGNLRLTLDKAA